MLDHLKLLAAIDTYEKAAQRCHEDWASGGDGAPDAMAELDAAERDLAVLLPGTDTPPWCNAVAHNGRIYALGPGMRVTAIHLVAHDDGTLAGLAGESAAWGELQHGHSAAD